MTGISQNIPPSETLEMTHLIIDNEHSFARYGWYFDDANAYYDPEKNIDDISSLVPDWKSFRAYNLFRLSINDEWQYRKTSLGHPVACGMVRL